ncbi:DNA cytosine methyltransferase [Anatilimnocola floriformis]|uniref:DNA cytosine methyltransferase n=1 Tax=Anatilimnocola floriformis TaxID=2948575 RepID=UPI0020C2C59F|nr:DNA cytosine methyltransferase [Anatilimnocola floriformis]
MNYLDLFSGIGGFALGAQWAGITFDNHLNSDIDAFCNKVYAHHFPGSINLGDITAISGHELREQYGKEWCISGGFPCQDISSAGKREGITGSRSGLWFQYHRLIIELRPKFIIIENVQGLFNRGFYEVLTGLANCGYDAEWQTVQANWWGLPHYRRRLFITAYPTGIRCHAIPESLQAKRSVANSTQFNCEADRIPISTLGQDAKATGLVCGEPLVLRRDDGLSAQLHKHHLARVKALGNSIVPYAARDIFIRWKQTWKSE